MRRFALVFVVVYERFARALSKQLSVRPRGGACRLGGIFVLGGTALVIGYRLMQLKGPSEPPEDY